MPAKKPRMWIQQALKNGGKKGALHRQLGVPADKKIPITTLRKAAKAPGKLGRRARLALTLRGFRRKKKR